MNDAETHAQLEQAIHRELQALPDLSAPPDIIRKVLGTISRQTSKPWWKCPWLEWPRPLQILSSGLIACLFALALWFHGDFLTGAHRLSHGGGDFFEFIKPLWTISSALFTALKAMLASVGPLILVAAAGIVAVIYLSTLILGTLIYRVGADNNHTSS